MRYTYEIYEKKLRASDHRVEDELVRVHTGVRVEAVELKADQIIRIFDNLNPEKAYVEFDHQDDLDGWIEAAARAFAWADASERPGTPEYAAKRGIDLSPEELSNLPDSNLKTIAAAGKPRVSAVPPIAIMALGAAMQNGAEKYGLFNWRDSAVTATVFYDAMMRHLVAWYSGERNAPDSGVHHLAHLMAGAAIILDAEFNNVLNDDRGLAGRKVTPDEAQFFKETK